MMAPLPPPNLSADRPELPRVRLEVRSGSGRSVSYEVGADEFLIGGASGCDLRIPAPNLPPVICQIIRKVDGIRVRRLTPVLPVLLNEAPLPANNPIPVNSGDTLSLTGLDITISVQHTGLIVPKFVPIESEGKADSPPQAAVVDLSEEHRKLNERRRLLDAEELSRRQEWQQKNEELIRRARDLDRQTEDLESDRVIWYRRRQEFEQELGSRQALLGQTGARSADLDARERELLRLKEELSNLRERLLKEYQDRRDELSHQLDEVREVNAKLAIDRAAFDAELEQRRAGLQSEVEKHQQSLHTEATQRRELLEEEFRQRRITFEAELAGMASQTESESLGRYREQFEELERLRALARDVVAQAEVEAANIRKEATTTAARQREALATELASHEPKSRELQERQDRLAAGLQELGRQRDLFAADRDILEKERETFEAGRAAETERLETWEHTLSERQTDLLGREEQLQIERSALERDRSQFQDDLVRLERRTAAIEEQEQATAKRAQEVDVRLEQLKRDSLEWEETIRLAAIEQERLQSESERLDRQKADLDAQSATLAERSGQLEAQQAVLAVLRAKLDRTRLDAEREVTQLASARTREDEALAELRTRIREAEELRAELTNVQDNAAQERRRLEERDTLLSVGLEEIRQQKESLTTETARLQQRESELDARTSEIADQAGVLKGRMIQALDLQARLEADRVALREREAALAQAEEARQTLQEQLRKRAEDLAARARALDEVARQVAADRAAIDQARSTIDNDRLTTADELTERRRQIEERAAEVSRQAADYHEKEEALARQVARLKDVGAAVATERKSMMEARVKWEADRTEAWEADRKSREELIAFRAQAVAEIEALRQQAPELEGQAIAALNRLSTARDTLRGHLAELHDFARLSREDLAGIRTQVQHEADRLREQEESLNRAKAEHRLSVAAFRQQLIEWQGQVAEMKRMLSSSESRLDARQAAVDHAAKQVDATTIQLAEQAEQLRRERETVTARRTEVERHLSDMREWYRKKLRELVSGRADNAARGAESVDHFRDMPRLATFDENAISAADATSSTLRQTHSLLEELDPGDRQLGELLRSHGLVDGDTLNSLWTEAGRQRRTLRQVLLASGAITLYQLALIEAGNLDALMLGRFRVIDRLRATQREAIYRVFDPTDRTKIDFGKTTFSQHGIHMLRHLSEAEMQDAVHPDEFRQRFTACRDAAHPYLAAVTEVLEINGRPAVLQEWLTGLFSADWPAQAAHPGCWVRLATMAAGGIEGAHRHGLVHGRITSDSFVLTASGALKVTGFGEPPWLAMGPVPTDATSAGDLRAFGQVVFGWSQLAVRKKGSAKPKQFPDGLLSVIRRLEADPEPPMADTVAAERPYESASELVADLNRIARETSFSDDAWEKLLKHVAENAPDSPAGLKRSA
jgi:chromosome segregation ATPase